MDAISESVETPTHHIGRHGDDACTRVEAELHQFIIDVVNVEMCVYGDSGCGVHSTDELWSKTHILHIVPIDDIHMEEICNRFECADLGANFKKVCAHKRGCDGKAHVFSNHCSDGRPSSYNKLVH